MPRGSKTGQALKRRAVAAGAIAGKPTRAIARRIGDSPRQVQRVIAQPETELIIADAFRNERKKLRLMAKRAVAAVERGLRAQKKTKADHIVQLRAVERYGDLLGLAAGEAKQTRDSGKGRHLVTWEDFLIIGRTRTEEVA